MYLFVFVFPLIVDSNRSSSQRENNVSIDSLRWTRGKEQNVVCMCIYKRIVMSNVYVWGGKGGLLTKKGGQNICYLRKSLLFS